ncbi:hypothetical protein [Segniliparus rugosus]|uniref:Uncharacterized protein n=1 Tax=Segniliparus rugosus (strain ATCC BAA-974 / DSM 45345 / CCUG 50838 / CIP 108380 / JCM 13579 / CDC 945) TaxID=679197 RepID=U1N587_SEGRC|nr:hypothetical protein [Segniliparus rugosus]ERG69324.1 hypothetical protein HMPREF9336_04215 [Segniliparus rugosus ATCC BAA-974]
MSTNDDWQSAEVDYQESAPPAAKFPQVGSSFEGTILAGWRQQATVYGTGEPRFHRDGQPIMQLVLLTAPDEPDCADDWQGVRRLYIDKLGLREGLKSALRQTGAVKPQPGGRIAVERGPADSKTNAHTFAIVYLPREENPRIPTNAREVLDRWQHLIPAKSDERTALSARAPRPVNQPETAAASPGLLYLRRMREAL